MSADVESTVLLARYLVAKAEEEGDRSSLDRAVQLLREVSFVESPHRRIALVCLGMALDRMYASDGRPDLLDEMVAVDEQLVEITEVDDVDYVQFMVNLAYSLRRQDEDHEDPAALDRAVELLRDAVGRPAVPNVDPTFTWLDLAVVLRKRFEASGRRADIDDAVEAARQGVAHARTAEDRARLRTAYAEVLLLRHGRWPDQRSRDDAAAELSAAAAVPGPGRAVRVGKLANALVNVYREDGTRSALDEAETAITACLAERIALNAASQLYSLLDEVYIQLSLGSDDVHVLDRRIAAARAAVALDPEAVGHLSHLSDSLSDRFARSKDPADLADALERSAVALAAADPADPQRGLLLSAHSRLLYARYKLTEDAATMDEAVELAGRAVASTMAAGADAGGVVDTFVTVLGAASAATGAAELLDEAVASARIAMTVARGERQEADAQTVLAHALHSRYDRGSGARPDLDEAIDAARRSARWSQAHRHPLLYSRWTELVDLLMIRFDQYEDAPDLDEAIDACEAALAVPIIRPGARAFRQAMLAALLLQRFDLAGDRADLDRGLSVGEAAAADPEQVEGLLAVLRTQTARHYIDRLRWRADVAIYDAAVKAAEASLAAAADDNERAGALNRVAQARGQRSQVTGSDEDQREAVKAMREAIALADMSRRSSLLRNLGTLLAAMYDATGHSELLQALITTYREALDQAEPDDPEIPSYLITMSTATRRMFQVSQDPDDIRLANAYARHAVTITRTGDPYRAARLSNLASGLAVEAKIDERPALLDEALATAKDAVAASSPDDTDRSDMLINVAQILRKREGALQRELDEAIDLIQQALAMLPRGDRRTAPAVIELGIALSDRFDSAHDASDLDAAFGAYRRVSTDDLATPDDRARASMLWGLAARTNGRRSDAVDGFAATVRLLPDLVPRHLVRLDQERGLSRFDGLARFAADSALAVGDSELAVTLLEQSRGVLLAQAFETRGDLTALREKYPRLADELESRRRALNTLDAAAPDGEAGPEQRIAARRAHVDAWREICDDVRAVPGFAEFLLPPSVATLLTAASEGAVVLLTTGEHRSAAFALTRSGLRTVDLPGLTAAVVGELSSTIFDALRTTRSVDADSALRGEEAILEVLDRLWTLLAAPVLEALGIDGPPESGVNAPRVWWVPSGQLSFLPIHAAGHHRPRAESDAPTVFDRVVSSYAPTVRSLLQMRAQAERGPVTPGLVVSLPVTTGVDDLPGADEEVRRIARLLPDAAGLAGPEATRDAVMTALARAAWVHFACHGVSYPDRPSQSRLLVYDHERHPLSVAEISRLQTYGEFAFLSACTTAQASRALTDEAIHLTSAFLLAGFRHVVGTLWSVNDLFAVRVATRVYGQLAASGVLDPGHAARALHAAVDEARKRWPQRPSAWAAYVHSGI